MKTENPNTPIFGTPEEARVAPKFEMPKTSMPGEVAYQLVHDEAMMDGNARLNLATFVTTWMDSARISCVDCTAGHCNVTCKYPNPSICTRFPSRKYSAVTSLKEISTAATSAGVTVHRPWIRLARSSVSIVPDDTIRA